MSSLEELARSKNIEFDKLDYDSRKETLNQLLKEYANTKYFNNSRFFDDLKFVYSLIYQIESLDQKMNDTFLPFISSLMLYEKEQCIFLPYFYKVQNKEYVFFVSIRVCRCRNGRGYNVIVGEVIKRLERTKFLDLCLEISKDLEKNQKFTKEYKPKFTNFTPHEVKISKRRPTKIFNIIKNVYLVVKKLNTPIKHKEENEQKQTLQTQLELLKLQIALVEKQLESLN